MKKSIKEQGNENMPCKNCGRTDLSLHTNYRCGDCGTGEHTPGPWMHQSNYVMTPDRSFVVAKCDREDNARLIAAAPEMLEALKDAREALIRLPDVDGAYRVTVLQEINKAIAKATRQAESEANTGQEG